MGRALVQPAVSALRPLIRILVTTAILTCIGVNHTYATPQVVRIDGSIFDSTGSPTSGNKDIQIKAYSAASGGTLLWTSDVYNTTVNAGRFTINLDAASGSPSLVDRVGERTAASGLYFQVEVDSGAANGSMDSAQIVQPRIRAKGSAFSLAAGTADALRGIPVSTSAPALGNILAYDGTKWSPSPASSDYFFTSVTGNVTAIAGGAYIATGTSHSMVTLPTTCALGDRVWVLGLGTGGWSLAPGASAILLDRKGNTGVGVYAPLEPNDNLEVICVEEPAKWLLARSSGTADPILCQSGSETFNYTGSDQIFTVPTGCGSFLVEMWGAGGGSVSSNGNGGAGGYATGTISGFTSGDLLTVIVGGGGSATGSSSYGGGGDSVGTSGGSNRGSGGGRSAVRKGAVEYITAGGGGGGAGSGAAANGGAGGGATGTVGDNNSGGATGGGGGGTSSGGAAGTASFGAYTGNVTAGSQYTGGRGGGGSAGGGGGGGYYGGGGGGGGANGSGGGGGGGGSSYVGGTTNGAVAGGSATIPPNTSYTNYSAGVGIGGTGGSAGGNGKVVISW